MGCLTSATAQLQVFAAAAAAAAVVVAAAAAAADKPPVAALHTCNVSHIAEIIASNRRLALPLQVNTAKTKP